MGNVGIGTTELSYKLDVDGIVNATGSSINGDIIYEWTEGSDDSGDGDCSWSDISGKPSGFAEDKVITFSQINKSRRD